MNKLSLKSKVPFLISKSFSECFTLKIKIEIIIKIIVLMTDRTSSLFTLSMICLNWSILVRSSKFELLNFQSVSPFSY